MLLINHCENQSKRRKERPITGVTITALVKEEMAYACRLFGTNSLNEREMWHVDSLLGNDL